MRKPFLILLSSVALFGCSQRFSPKLSKTDYNRDVLLETSKGDITLRLFNLTPQHRDNFLRLVKAGFYDSILFHRVINQFMIQAGDPNTRPRTPASKKTSSRVSKAGMGTAKLIPAEFHPDLFHRKGVLAAARTGDDVNPAKASSATQFYIVQGRRFTAEGLDSVETNRLKGRKLPEEHRRVYTSVGGSPHLDQNYTIFGEVVKGLSVVDSIAAVPTTGTGKGDKPITPVYIRRAKLVKRATHEQ